MNRDFDRWVHPKALKTPPITTVLWAFLWPEKLRNGHETVGNGEER